MADPDGCRPKLPERDGEDTLHYRPVQGEERGAGEGDTAVAGDSGQGVEEGGRAEAAEIRTCRP